VLPLLHGSHVFSLEAWHFEPTVISGSFIVISFYVYGALSVKGGFVPWKAASFALGVVLMFLSLVSPLDVGADRLLSLHMLQHVYLGVDFSMTHPQAPATSRALARSERFYDSVRAAARVLSAELEVWHGARELKPLVTAIGHAHIDLAWLWRLQHSREKASRTFSTALHLMRQYPEYCFMHSAPQAYKFLETDYPEIFEQVKTRVAEGRWEITGGMWVEADTNLIGGESLVRQFLYGVRYAQGEFGVDMRVLWLPDVFGYSYALPQVAVKSGIRYFVTSKISWSQFNRFPYDTFRWRGLDGTELLTHFITTPELESPGTAHTYNGQVTPAEVRGMWENYRQKDINEELLMLFGWGDGGGGPTREMLDRADVLRNLPGFPKVSLGRAEPFFERLTDRLRGEDVPVWDGELYLEIHRGTYTSQAFLKRANRKAEILYHNSEWLSSMADVLLGEHEYPMDELRAGWEAILLHQFHDILPGSSIRQVYEDAGREYERIEATGWRTLTAALDRVAWRVKVDAESVLVFNPLSWSRDDILALPWDGQRPPMTVVDQDGNAAPCQVVQEGIETRLLVEVHRVPALGYSAYPLVPAKPQRGSGER
jgi:alpha-mannosidase